MPQLDVSTFPSQLFWLAISFFILYVILSYIALPKISRLLESRETLIQDKINLASTYREEAEGLLANYEALLAKAKEDSHLTYQTSAKVIVEELAEKQKERVEKLEERLHLAEQELYRARLQAEEELQSIVEEISEAVLAKISAKAPQKTTSKGRNK